ncbi:MAG: UDP-4-amino-4,6-dideoxy-N-acetyl-beta-L-altrosamine transaminase [Candidatus Omnitrophica bacterium]|nr:UDP-4-amino-4,6-dideoxy-N-acetyl-beta-L-altrosamine transaminase [Candidatus Omnitrophota bacterium]
MKFIPYSHQAINSADIKAVVKALKSEWLTQGPNVQKFEKSLCVYTKAKYAVAVSSGTAALHLACLAAGIKKNNEVITSPITFVASANCVLYCGGKPVFADVYEDTVNINPKELEKRINKRTKAIIPVHFAGHPCAMADIYRLAKKHNLAVIEDAAHALGSSYLHKGKRIKIGAGKHSDMTVFSFHPLKAITTGEGGAILTNSKTLYDRLLLFRSHGITKDGAKLKRKKSENWYYEMQELGYNYRISDIQCALGANQMKRLDRFMKIRQSIAAYYQKELRNIEELILPVQSPRVRSAWHLYTIRVNSLSKRKKVFQKLRAAGIGVQVHYIPIYQQPYYQALKHQKNAYPIANKYYDSAISLPIHPSLSTKQVAYVCKTLKGILYGR